MSLVGGLWGFLVFRLFTKGLVGAHVGIYDAKMVSRQRLRVTYVEKAGSSLKRAIIPRLVSRGIRGGIPRDDEPLSGWLSGS